VAKLVGARTQHCAQDRLDALERPTPLAPLDQRVEAALHAHHA
jgi:hypothetical protein